MKHGNWKGYKVVHMSDIRLHNNAGINMPVCKAGAKRLDLDASRMKQTDDFSKVTCTKCRARHPKRYPWAVRRREALVEEAHRASRHGEYGSRTRRGHGDVTLHTAVIDGKRIGYSSETEFLVQIGKGRGAYKTKYRIVGNLGQAAMYYQGLNIGHGYKKRLLMPSSSKNPVLARASS